MTPGKRKSRAEMRVTVVTAPGTVQTLLCPGRNDIVAGGQRPVPPGDTVTAPPGRIECDLKLLHV